jgi:hypothetical protein
MTQDEETDRVRALLLAFLTPEGASQLIVLRDHMRFCTRHYRSIWPVYTWDRLDIPFPRRVLLCLEYRCCGCMGSFPVPVTLAPAGGELGPPLVWGDCDDLLAQAIPSRYFRDPPV